MDLFFYIKVLKNISLKINLLFILSFSIIFYSINYTILEELVNNKKKSNFQFDVFSHYCRCSFVAWLSGRQRGGLLVYVVFLFFSCSVLYSFLFWFFVNIIFPSNKTFFPPKILLLLLYGVRKNRHIIGSLKHK